MNCATAATASARSNTKSVGALTEIDGGYVLNTQGPDQMGQLFTHLGGEGDLAGIVNCWPLDIAPRPKAVVWVQTL